MTTQGHEALGFKSQARVCYALHGFDRLRRDLLKPFRETENQGRSFSSPLWHFERQPF